MVIVYLVFAVITLGVCVALLGTICFFLFKRVKSQETVLIKVVYLVLNRGVATAETQADLLDLLRWGRERSGRIR